MVCYMKYFAKYKKVNVFIRPVYISIKNWIEKTLSWHVEETNKCIWFKEQENKHGEEGSSIREIFFLSFFFWLIISYWRIVNRASLVAQTVKNLPAMWETRIRSLGWKDSLEVGMATHSSVLAWRIPWTEEPGGLWSMGSQRVGYDWATNTFTNSQLTMLWWF